jgi:5-amino-6-(5-phospho-D-ribitylamino)uracil phosphatase
VSIRLVALDLDGTLLTSRKSVSPRAREALAAAESAGARIVLVTGRRLPAARSACPELAARLPLVLHNGALVVEDDAVVRCRPLAREAAAAAVALGLAAGADPVIHRGQGGEGRLVVSRVAAGNELLRRYLDRAGEDLVSVPDLLASLGSGEDPIQVMFGGTLEAMRALAGRLDSELAGAVHVERTAYPEREVSILDVLAPGVSKAEAVAWLQGRWGIASRETLAIGDNWNDRRMLEQAGVGLVMGNAEPGLRALGLPVLPSNDDDGVAVALERYVVACPPSAADS